MVDDGLKSFKEMVSGLYPDYHIGTVIVDSIKLHVETKSINFTHIFFYGNEAYSVFIMNNKEIIIPIDVDDCGDHFKTVLHASTNPTKITNEFRMNVFDTMESEYFIIDDNVCVGIIHSYSMQNNAYDKYKTWVEHRYIKLENYNNSGKGFFSSIKKIICNILGC